MVDKENFGKDINAPSKEQIMINGIDVSRCVHLVGKEACNSRYCRSVKCGKNLNCLFKQLAYKTHECNELKIENEELNNRMAEVTYRATGGRLSYSNYTLDAIEQAFNDQLEILSDQKVEEEIKELNQKLYLVQNEVYFKTEYIQEQREEIKQLEQECEELKERLAAQENINNHIADYQVITSKILDRYRKALEEIEEIANETCIDSQSDCKSCNFSCEHKDILDIINKAKGTDNGLS